MKKSSVYIRKTQNIYVIFKCQTMFRHFAKLLFGKILVDEMNKHHERVKEQAIKET